MSRIIVPPRRLWTPPRLQRGYVVIDAYRNPAGGVPTDFWYDDMVAASSHALVFDINDMGSLYQDTAGATPVTALGQTFKAIRNKGPTGGLATSSTGAVLQYSATYDRNYFVPPSTNSFTFTGAADFLGEINLSVIAIGELQGNTSNYEYLFQFGLDSDGSYHRLAMGNVVGEGFKFFSGGAGGAVPLDSIPYRTGAGVFIGTRETPSPSNADYCDLNAYRDGTLLTGSGYVHKNGVVSNVLSLGDYTTGGAAPCAKLFGLVAVDRVITSGERADAVAGGLG